MVLQPALTMSVISMVAVNCVGITKAVVRGLLLNCTIDPWAWAQTGGLMGIPSGRQAGGGGVTGATKGAPLPLTVRVNAAPPGLAVTGVILEMSGVALLTGLMMKVTAFWLGPPPGAGLEAVMTALPGEATSEARIDIAT